MLEVIKNALTLPEFDSISAQNRMAPTPRTSVRPPDKKGKPKNGAVMLILYDKKNRLHVLLIKRQENLSYHPGQISFPGGTHEGTETFLETALRETHEEVGISPDRMIVSGELHPVYVPPSDFMVYPFVAWHNSIPICTPDPAEVAGTIEVKIEDLMNNSFRDSETKFNNGSETRIPYFKADGYKIWGATAMILNELLERLKAAEG